MLEFAGSENDLRFFLRGKLYLLRYFDVGKRTGLFNLDNQHAAENMMIYS